jgi:hypothetical protein
MNGGNGISFRRGKVQNSFRADCEWKQSVLRVGGGGRIRKIKDELGGEGGS